MDEKQAKKLRRNVVLSYRHPFGHGKRNVKIVRKFPKASQALVQDMDDSGSYEIVPYACLEFIPIVISIWMAGWKKNNSKHAQFVWSYKKEEVKEWVEKAGNEKNTEWVTPIFEYILPPQQKNTARRRFSE